MNNARLDLLWKNYPSDESPINEVNLNRMVRSINLTDENVHNLDENKASKEELLEHTSKLFKEARYDKKTGILTFTRKNGETITIDTPLEMVALDIYYDPVTEMLTLPLEGGGRFEVDLSRLITELEFLNSDTIAISVEEGKVRAIVKEGSIEEKHLRPDYLADIRVEQGKAQASQREAAESATESESWAHGGTNTRPNEETDNARAYAKKAEEYSNDWKGSLLPQGTILFSQLPTSGNVAGHLYNISQAFETDSRFEEGAGYSYPAGTNVYWNGNSKWDCLSGALTKVLTQAEYDSLLESEKNNGTIYYITDSDNELSNATDTVPGVVIVDSILSETSKNPVQNKAVTERMNAVSRDLERAENRQKSYTDTKIADLINGAPSTLDTLGEIADAMENNQTVIEALNSAIGTKVDKVSGKGLSTNDYTTAEKTKLAGVAANANNYSLPAASASTRGGVKTGYAQTGKNYPVQLSNEQMYVNVPWTDTQKITGVKGNAESSYRTGNVNITAANIGLGNVNNTSDSNKNVATANQVNGVYTGGGGSQPPSYITIGKTRFNMMHEFKGIANPAGGFMDTILMDNYTGGDVPYVTGIGVTKNNGNPRMFIANGARGNGMSWAHQVEAITTGNINSQSVNYATKAAQDSDGNVIKSTYAKYRKVTQAEYNDLPSTKNSDNVVYFITG